MELESKLANESEFDWLANPLDDYHLAMDGATEVTLPIGNHFKFSVDQCPKTENKKKEEWIKFFYANAVISVMYMLWSVLDLILSLL